MEAQGIEEEQARRSSLKYNEEESEQVITSDYSSSLPLTTYCKKHPSSELPCFILNISFSKEYLFSHVNFFQLSVTHVPDRRCHFPVLQLFAYFLSPLLDSKQLS